nr:MAG TPA: hypothetical protein [Caudoviricetes sp.]
MTRKLIQKELNKFWQLSKQQTSTLLLLFMR